MHAEAVEAVHANASLSGSIIGLDPIVNPDLAKQAFLDNAAIALYAKGWPEKDVFTRAERLWTLRNEHIAKDSK
jgi:hypothetical protein